MDDARRKKLEEQVAQIAKQKRVPRRSNRDREPLDEQELAYMRMMRNARDGVPEQEPSGIPILTVGPVACEYCRDLGYVRMSTGGIHDVDFGKLTPCPHCNGEGDKRNTSLRLQKASRLTPAELRFSLSTFWLSTPQRQRALRAMTDLLDRGHGWLTLWGSNGSSKSFLAIAAVTATLGVGQSPDVWNGKGAQYWMLADLLDALREAYDPAKGEQDYDSLFDDLTAVPLLVVDECAAFSPKAWALEKMRQLAERRYREEPRRTTIWICNLSPLEETKDGGPLAFLFSRMSQFQVIELNEGDVRPALGERFQHE